jgi:hypothetical protein
MKGSTMKDVTLNKGTVVSDTEFVETHGDSVATEFAATKADLALLANALVNQLLANEEILSHQTSRRDQDRREYTSHRLDRVMEFVPELEGEIQEKLRIGREENKARYNAYLKEA